MKVDFTKKLLVLFVMVSFVVANFACGAGAKFELGSLSISPAAVMKGNSLVVSVDVTNTGKAEGNFEANLKIDDILKENKTVPIAVGQKEIVSFTVTADTAGTHTVKVNELTGTFNVLMPPQFANLAISPPEVEVGKQATVSVDITNTETILGNYTITLKINNVDEETKTVTIGANQTKTVSFLVIKENSGTYNISLGGLSGSLTVFKPAGFTLSNLVISPAQAVAGQAVSIMCDIANTGGVQGSYAVSLQLNGVQADSKEVTVAAGAKQTVAFSLVKDIGGTYFVAIENLTGTLVVSEGVVPILHVGDQWVYREISTGIAYTVTRKIVGEEQIQGKACYVIEMTYDPAMSGVSKRTVWEEKATTDEFREQYSLDYLGTTVTCSSVYDSTYSGDERWPLKVGSNWMENLTIVTTWEALGESETETTTNDIQYRLEKKETITVGAGTFTCFKIVGYENGEVTRIFWYADKAKDVVKADFPIDEDSLQLLSYSVK